MKSLQRPWFWPWAALFVVALFGSAAMLGIELGLVVLIFAGLIALVALRQIGERPNSESQDNPTLWHCQETHALQGSRVFPSLADGMSIAPGQLAITADLQPQLDLEAAALASRVPEMTAINISIDITFFEDGFSARAASGWACDFCFRSARERFVALGAPEDALPNLSIDRWRCERVLADIQKERMAVTLPANAHAGYLGKRGECDDAFREQQDSCRAP